MITIGSVRAIFKVVGKRRQFWLNELKFVNGYLSGIIGEILVTVDYLNVAEINVLSMVHFSMNWQILGLRD